MKEGSGCVRQRSGLRDDGGRERDRLEQTELKEMLVCQCVCACVCLCVCVCVHL